MSVVVPVRRAPDTIVSTMTELLERQGLEIIAGGFQGRPDEPASAANVGGTSRTRSRRSQWRLVRPPTPRTRSSSSDWAARSDHRGPLLFQRELAGGAGPSVGRSNDRGGGRSRRQRTTQEHPGLGRLFLALRNLDAARRTGFHKDARRQQCLLPKRIAQDPCGGFARRFLGTRIP